jgi:AcrR family transcriptional regulator
MRFSNNMKVEISRSDDIVSVATLLFRAKGYHATSMTDVADRCRIQKPSLYYHFASKEDLALAVMSETQAYFDSYLFRYACDGTLSPQRRLLKITQTLEKYFSIEHSGCVFANFAIETMDSIPDFVAPIRHYFDCWSKSYQAIFNTIYGKDDVKALADSFVSDLQGALIMMKVTGTDAPLRRLSARLLRAAHAKPFPNEESDLEYTLARRSQRKSEQKSLANKR